MRRELLQDATRAKKRSVRWLLMKKVLSKKVNALERGKAVLHCHRVELIAGRRYIHRGRYMKQLNNRFEFLLRGDDHRSFRANFRTSRGAFDELVTAISGHAVFHSSTRKPQAPVAHQLMVFMHYIGTKGCTTQHMKSKFQCGYGTVYKYVWRVCEAFESLAPATIYWPNRREKVKIKEYYGRRYHWPDCVGSIDGTCIPLFCKPQEDGEDYLDRKSNYSVNLQAVVDPDGRVRWWFFGPPGSQHDSTCLSWSQMGKQPGKFFKENEHLLGDSAYTNCRWMITSYKTPARKAMPKIFQKFNWMVASPRVQSERAFGCWKGRFPYFSDVRINITGKSSAAKLDRLVTASLVIHNLMIGSHLDMSYFVEDPYQNIENDFSRDSFMAREGEDAGAHAQVHRFFHAHNYFKGVVTYGRGRVVY
jgi:hypothetical protein